MLPAVFFINSIFWEVGLRVGGSLIGANLLFTLFAGILLMIQQRRIKALSMMSGMSFLFITIYAVPVTVAGPCTGELLRAGFSAAAFFVFFVTAFEIGRTAAIADWLMLQRASVWVVWVGIVSVLIEFAIPGLFPGTAEYRALGKYSGMFNEPSHLAMAMSPALLVLLRSERRRHRQLGLYSFVFLFVASRATTLVGVVGLYFAYSAVFVWRGKIAAKAFVGACCVVLALVLAGGQSFIEPVTTRLSGVFSSTEASEASGLVYSAGIYDAVNNFSRTFGMGTGFNTMGCAPLPENPVRDFLALAQTGEEALNTRDGSFLVAKVVSEFGIFGIAMFIALCLRLRSFEKRTASAALPGQKTAISVIATLLLSFLVISIVRSTGYFSGSVFLGILALGGTFGLPPVEVRSARVTQ